MAKTRIYRVDSPDGPRLVEATTVNGAIQHVARKTITAALATQHDLFEAGKAGAVVEKAGEEPVAQQPSEPVQEGGTA